MKTSPAIILTLTRPNGQFWTRVRIGARHWQHLERRAKSLETTVLGLLLASMPERRAVA